MKPVQMEEEEDGAVKEMAIPAFTIVEELSLVVAVNRHGEGPTLPVEHVEVSMGEEEGEKPLFKKYFYFSSCTT